MDEKESVSSNSDSGVVNHSFVHIPDDPELPPKTNPDQEKEEEEQEVDPWDLVNEVKLQTPFSELSTAGKVGRIAIYFVLTILVLCFLYLFICSIDLLGSSFQLMTGRTAGAAFSNSELLDNPVCCLMIGVGVTVLLQSSSTSTSIIITMVGARIIPVENGIYIIMGTNIGTTVTNTIVALGQIAEKNEFRRAFAGASVHDAFNWLAVLILLPLEVVSGYLFHLTKAIVDTIPVNTTLDDSPEFLKVITEPLTTSIVRVDKSVVYAIVDYSVQQKRPLSRYLCDEGTSTKCYDYDYGTNVDEDDYWRNAFTSTDKEYFWARNNYTENGVRNATCFDMQTNKTDAPVNITRLVYSVTNFNLSSTERCSHWFAGAGLPNEDVIYEGDATGENYVPQYLNLSDGGAGAIIFVFSIILLCSCLVGMVKILSYLFNGPLLKIIQKVINYEGTYTDSNGEVKTSLALRELVGYGCILIGAGLTVLVQSSSVFTSTLTPLVGMGIITVERMYPLTLGANIGTTITGLIAGFTSPPETIRDALQVSFAHLFYNISAILLFYPVFIMRRLPVRAAKFLGNTVADYRWFAFVYLILVFFIAPGLVFALSVPGWYVLFAVALPFIIILIAVIVINTMQTYCINSLPKKLQTWDFLPVWLRSLEPYDRLFRKCCPCKTCQVPDQTKVSPVEVDVPMKYEDGELKKTSQDDPPGYVETKLSDTEEDNTQGDSKDTEEDVSV